MANITFTEGSGVNNSVFGKSQEPIKMFLEKRGEEFEATSVLPEIFLMETSKHFGEKLTTMTAMNGFQPVGENGAYPVDGMQEGYSKFLEHMTWKNSFSLSKEIIDDATAMDLRKQPQGFITSFYRTREKYGAALLGNAVQGNASMTFGGKSFACTAADGQNLFYASHPSKVSGGTQCNLFSDAFSADALAALECKMNGFKGDNDELLDVAPDTIIIPNEYALKQAVFAAIGADKDPATANNGFNFQFGRWNVIVWNYMDAYIGSTNTQPWILMDSKYNKEYGGGVWFDRETLSVRSTIDENTDANVWRGRARFVAGFNDWRAFAVAGISGATALIS